MLIVIPEHFNGIKYNEEYDFKGSLPFDKDYFYQFTKRKRVEKLDCFRIYSDKANQKHAISNGYFIGVDWIIEGQKAIYVEPKINKEAFQQTDYLKMLFSALEHPEVANYTDDLFEIKWDELQIKIKQEQDLLTPLIIVQFLKVVQAIVRKGLKKSYYKVEHNLYGKVKGKILVGQTVKQNLLKNKTLNTFCTYDEFGLNGLENRLLKKALVFVKCYLPTIVKLKSEAYTANVFSYINPAFESVSEEVSLHDVKNTKTNVFYKEYEVAIKLAKLILKRFGYNITNASTQDEILTPPFWIDMSKLFELYVFGILLDNGHKVEYQYKANYGEPDFLLIDEQKIADSKYKTYYKFNIKGNSKRDEIAKDIRQLSGYGRDTEVLKKLGFKSEVEQNKVVVKCLIIYPDQDLKEPGLDKVELPIDGFAKFYKRAVRLPVIDSK